MADVKILEKARTSFFQDDDLIFINQNNALRQVPARIMAEKVGGLVPEATTELAGLMTAQDKETLDKLNSRHVAGIIPAYKLDYAGRTAADVAADLLQYIDAVPGGGTLKLNIGVGNTAAFVGYWNANDDSTILLAGEWSALEIIGVCRDNGKLYAKLRLTNYNTNKTYETILNGGVYKAWTEMINSGTAASYGNPTGTFIYWPGKTPPAGWLICNGAEISRETYRALFEVIGTTWGEGNGSTTFNLPNAIDRVVQGAATAGTYKTAGLPNIEGFFQVPANRGGFELSGGAMQHVNPDERTWSFPAANIDSSWKPNEACIRVTFNASRYNSIYGGSTTVQPPALTMLPIIKY